MSKDYTLANESLASLKVTHSELQSSLSSLTEKYKTLEANFSSLWESTKATPSKRLDSSASTSKNCSSCSNIDINALKTNHARIEEKIKSKDKEIARLNMLITQGNICAKSIPKIVDKQGLGHRKNNKANGRVVVKGHEIPLWNKGGYLNTIMDIAHGVTTSTTTKEMPKMVNTTKGNGGVNSPPKASKIVVEHKPSSNYTCDYIVTLDHNGKMVVKYVGAYTMKAMRKSVWVPKVYALLTDKTRIHLRSASVRTYTFFNTGFPRFLSIRGARGLLALNQVLI
jgi:prefoldin subunit 5